MQKKTNEKKQSRQSIDRLPIHNNKTIYKEGSSYDDKYNDLTTKLSHTSMFEDSNENISASKILEIIKQNPRQFAFRRGSPKKKKRPKNTKSENGYSAYKKMYFGKYKRLYSPYIQNRKKDDTDSTGPRNKP